MGFKGGNRLKMKILVIGSGAREHAIAWKLGLSPRVDELLIAPGNAGTASLGANLSIDAADIHGLADAAHKNGVDLTVVGPEGPLAAGIVDRFMEEGLVVFGPTQAAARIESSKAFAKDFMQRHHIPCAESVTFDSYAEAHRFVQSREGPVVVKADGLAAGKGVVMAATRDEAISALDASMNRRVFGDAGAVVIIEDLLEGPEVSVFAFTDGRLLSPLVAACDYKRAQDGDRGLNTGGMGSYSPPEFWTEALADQVEGTIFTPAVHGMAEEGYPYTGVLFGGLMLTRNGPKVIEFNARLGDPEAQVILPRLKSDLADVMLSVAEGDLTETQIHWSNEAYVGVVVASGGYPGGYDTGFPIAGLDSTDEHALVFHAGTAVREGEVVTSGGRVLTVVGRGASVAEARERAYDSARHVEFQGAYYRTDIAARPVGCCRRLMASRWGGYYASGRRHNRQ